MDLYLKYLKINFIFIIINVYCLIVEEKIKFKNVEIFSLSLIKKFAKQDIKYLMNKYNQNDISNNNNNNIKKKIFINIVGNCFKKIYLKRIIQGLEKDFVFIFTDNNPDYLVYDVYNCEFLSTKYKDAIKISFYSENMLPDFNKADYAIAFHNLNYLDRYYKITSLKVNFRIGKQP
jgi:hypothetical protein